jgi:hypothetical protein
MNKVSEDVRGKEKGASGMSDVQSFMQKMQDEKQQRLEWLRQLLNEYLITSGGTLVTKGQMGKTEYYNGAFTLAWIANINLASELPLLRTKVDPETGHLIVDQESVEELRQRAPQEDRTVALAHYLLKSPVHMFPSILAVVSEPWVDDPETSEWVVDEGSGQKVAAKTSITFEPLDKHGESGTVDLRNVTIYALDGQHRVMSIRAVRDLLQKGYLEVKNSKGDVIHREPKEELLERFSRTEGEFNRIIQELMGVTLIPAVVKGETYEEARIRVRSVFVHVNKTARPLTAGELALLDEDDGFAIVSRHVALTHPLFRQNEPGDRVNWKGSALPAGSKWLSPHSTIVDMTRGYLKQAKPYSNWLPKHREEIPLRPEEADLEQGRKKMEELFDRYAELPVFSDILRGGKIDEWREFPNKGGKGHLLMRPIGQQILAEAVGKLHTNEDGPQLSLNTIFKKLKRFDSEGKFEVADPSSIWYLVTYDGKRMVVRNQKLAVDLLAYLVNGLEGDTRDDLLERYRAARTFLDEDGKEMAYNFDGKKVMPGKVQLPPMV